MNTMIKCGPNKNCFTARMSLIVVPSLNCGKALSSNVSQKNSQKHQDIVGCGSGGVSLYFHNTRGYEVELVDLSDEALSFARRNFETHGRKPLHTTFRKADATQLPYPDDVFDLVMSF